MYIPSSSSFSLQKIRQVVLFLTADNEHCVSGVRLFDSISRANLIGHNNEHVFASYRKIFLYIDFKAIAHENSLASLHYQPSSIFRDVLGDKVLLVK